MTRVTTIPIMLLMASSLDVLPAAEPDAAQSPPLLSAAERSAPGGQAGLARQILGATGVRGGLVVQLGCGDGRLAAALGADGRCVVHGLDADPQNVENAREHVRQCGLEATS